MKELIIVSGLPRSGTSMMMQILAAGGVNINTDGVRIADEHNPYGYFENVKAKKIFEDPKWLYGIDGAVKIMSDQLFYLPDDINYKIIFMVRDINDVIRSQEKMAGCYPDKLIKEKFKAHLKTVLMWMTINENVRFFCIRYEDIRACPAGYLYGISGFLQRDMDIEAMAAAIKK